jgi:hypothetical protein
VKGRDERSLRRLGSPDDTGVKRIAAVPTGSLSPGYPPPENLRETGAEPQGCEWLKHATGLGEEQAVKVVGNGGGGTKRGWKLATRRRATNGVRASGRA